ncbi:MAG TPA: flagellar hook-basal body complex protein FliE [Nevskiaceae bacterium]|nr:flagellar hook-basal body complex protein FliE [Nevskiaceae bacterium]
MSDIDVTRVLSQIRSLQAQSAGFSRAAESAAAPAAAAGAPAFGRVLEAALDRVSLSQGAAASLQARFETGDSNTDLASVMLASSRAQVEFKGLVEVRNRLVRAYQDIMNMPI